MLLAERRRRVPRLLVGALIGAILTTGGAGFAQPERPAVRLTPLVTTKVVRPGSTVSLTLRVVLPRGLHVQSNKPRDPGLIPTVLTVDTPPGFSIVDVVYPQAVDFVQTRAKQTLAVYPNEFEVVVNLKVGAGVTGRRVVPASLRYQACDDSICFIPARAQTAWTVTITNG